MDSKQIMSTVLTAEISLCAQEPIRIPGGIQPHGALIVLDPATLRILQASANAADVIERARPGATLADIDHALTREVQSWLSDEDPIFLRTAKIGTRAVQVLGHRTAQGVRRYR